ncbi:hypothetical protein OH77DRAFT_408030 [Trametes cingulata]|nr:hypothetical protein OH77DRAFT_408030 [Trametes cingulata]
MQASIRHVNPKSLLFWTRSGPRASGMYYVQRSQFHRNRRCTTCARVAERATYRDIVLYRPAASLEDRGNPPHRPCRQAGRGDAGVGARWSNDRVARPGPTWFDGYPSRAARRAALVRRPSMPPLGCSPSNIDRSMLRSWLRISNGAHRSTFRASMRATKGAMLRGGDMSLGPD